MWLNDQKKRPTFFTCDQLTNKTYLNFTTTDGIFNASQIQTHRRMRILRAISFRVSLLLPKHVNGYIQGHKITYSNGFDLQTFRTVWSQAWFVVRLWHNMKQWLFVLHKIGQSHWPSINFIEWKKSVFEVSRDAHIFNTLALFDYSDDEVVWGNVVQIHLSEPSLFFDAATII